MNALTRFDRLDNLFPEMFRRLAQPMQLIDESALPGDIRLDISENDKEYLVSAEISGARKDDIRVAIEGNYVSISADVTKEQKERHGWSLVRETYHGSVSRGFTLASEVDDKASVAKLEDGVLRLTLPKREGSASRTLKIQWSPSQMSTKHSMTLRAIAFVMATLGATGLLIVAGPTEEPQPANDCLVCPATSAR